EKEQIESGNAVVQITAQLAGFVGPALAGLVIASLSGAVNLDQAAATGIEATRGVGFALGFDVLTFVVAAVALWRMRGGRKGAVPSEKPQQSIRESIMEGLRAVWSDTALRTTVFVTMAINFLFTGPMGVGLPVLSNTRFAEGAAALGVMLSAFGGGALVGALLGGSLPTPRRLGIIAMVLIAVAGVGMAAYGFVTSLALAALVGALMGATVGYVNVVMISWLQKRTDPQLLGRVMSLVMLGTFGLGPISNAIAGLLVDVNINFLFLSAGVLLIAITLSSLANRDIRAIDGTASAA
ncbi:MAG: MFS transporter, partial [Anaerolineae bacterium]|nr:MFS transporter [Anaerolineae bacterium]